VGAAVQGWDQTGKLSLHLQLIVFNISGSNGANLTFPEAFGISSPSTRDSYLVGLINAAPYIGSAFLGCWLSDPLNKYLGRRGAIFISGNFCLWSVLGSAFTRTWPQLLVCRILLGIGMGAKASTIPIYAAENSPASIRGACKDFFHLMFLCLCFI
jgi:MFS family permease